MAGGRWSGAIVVGGSSGIGAAIARALAGEGCRVAALARREAALRVVAATSALVRAYVHDVTRTGDVPGLFEQITRDLGELDLIVYAAGIMPRTGADAYDTRADEQTIATNLTGAIAWLNEAATRFGDAGRGTIVGVGSVAGDRGRRGTPAYAASKAGLDTYLEALRNRLAGRGVAVVTVKPGPVATPMSDGLPRLPLLISADRAATEILAAARRGSGTAYVPRVWRPIMFAIRQIPSRVFRRLDI